MRLLHRLFTDAWKFFWFFFQNVWGVLCNGIHMQNMELFVHFNAVYGKLLQKGPRENATNFVRQFFSGFFKYSRLYLTKFL